MTLLDWARVVPGDVVVWPRDLIPAGRAFAITEGAGFATAHPPERPGRLFTRSGAERKSPGAFSLRSHRRSVLGQSRSTRQVKQLLVEERICTYATLGSSNTAATRSEISGGATTSPRP